MKIPRSRGGPRRLLSMHETLLKEAEMAMPDGPRHILTIDRSGDCTIVTVSPCLRFVARLGGPYSAFSAGALKRISEVDICHEQKEKHDLAEQLDIPFRDMRVVDPLVRTISWLGLFF